MEGFIYFFAEGKAEGNGEMKDLLGGKGAGIAEMTNAGLPVPPGFTIATSACRHYIEHGARIPSGLEQEIAQAVARLERVQGQKLGGADNPLLVSVRSGAKFSMPGMMDTILNLGLNDASVEGLARRASNRRFALDCYRRLIQMFGNVVLDIEKSAFVAIFDRVKRRRRARTDTELSAEGLEEVMAAYRKLIRTRTGQDFPQNALNQLRMARDAVFRSWNNDRAVTYRRLYNIPDGLGTAVNVQAMVFGNLGDRSGTGVGFTRNPATGAKEFYGEFLLNAQGEDVVAGIRTPLPISDLKKIMPEVFDQLHRITSRLEHHYRDVQDFEFTIQDGRLYMLQTRTGKRTGQAAVKIAVDFVHEGLLEPQEALLRVEPDQLNQLLHPVIDLSQKLNRLAKGLPASPGAAVGQIVFTANEAAARGKQAPVILVRAETVPDDIHGMEAAVGILTARGGMTSHAAVVARGMGKPCVAGCEALHIDERNRRLTLAGRSLVGGDWISLDGGTGEVFLGRARTIEPDASSGDFAEFIKWADAARQLRVRANADIPRDALAARRFGAEGIGLCRTEHMFFAQHRLPHMQAMILADTDEGRRRALKRLLPMQRKDFVELLRTMSPYPVTIRLLDPPLHEFLPKRENLMVEIAQLEAKRKKSPKLPRLKKLLRRVEELHEFNPMLGLRGCRLGILYPEISAMQARAIFEAAVLLAKQGVKVIPEVMIPLVGYAKELQLQRQIVVKVAEEVFREKGMRVDYLVGTMIELPRAALAAAEIAQVAEFFSFGTNDLTQMTLGLSRDDSPRIIREYVRMNIYEKDPFATLDQSGVGQLVEMGTRQGRAARPKLKVGICGEHGGDPASVEFCHRVGLDYVSCSPYRVPIARLAAAQAAVRDKFKDRQPSTSTA